MKKRIAAFVFLLILCCISVSAADSDFTIEDGVLTKYNGSGGDVVIPDSITNIGKWAFLACDSLTSVTISNSVTNIGYGAFSDCTNLTSVTIGNSVTNIESVAFSGCISLARVTIPESVTSIDNGAFYWCSNLKDVYYSGSEMQWETILIGHDNDITFATVHYNSDGSEEPTPADNVMARGNCGENLTWVLTNDCALTISGTGQMTDYYSSVDVPWSGYSFRRITSVIIQNGVTSIGNYAFFGCNDLTDVTIPDSITSIGDSAFDGCRRLTHITLPDNVTVIEWYAFYGCSGLTSITIPSSVTSIGGYAFYGCSSLKSVYIPISVIRMGKNVCAGCSSLTDIYYQGTEEQGHAIDIDDTNLPYLSNVTIHFESAGATPSVPASIPVRETVPSDQYCIHVVDENGKPLKGATVYWEDSAETLTGDTDNNGDVYFSALTLGVPKIDVSLSGYISWTNRNSNWSKSDKRYSEVILYDEAHGAYKLASAYYSNVGNETSWHNLLTTTKKLNLKNDGNLVGDLDFGNFYLTCTACTTQGVDRYELWQNDKKISQCPDGRFPRLSVTSFSKGGGCFVRVIAETGEEVDTAINLQFAENKVKQDTSVKFGKNGISITIADDDIPYFGGSTIDINTLVSLPANITVTEDKIRFELNTKPKKDREEAKKQFDILRGFADESKI
ncbi:MAG: leucine-rich repeat protein [Oscillospiraceae bacterium]|nr:leucine-rich repeat protein [Oscillospiraceae bacterium]